MRGIIQCCSRSTGRLAHSTLTDKHNNSIIARYRLAVSVSQLLCDDTSTLCSLYWPPSSGFTYAEYLSSALWALTLSCRTAILHCNSSWVLDIYLCSTLNTICLHFTPPLPHFSQRLSHSDLLVNRFFTQFIGIAIDIVRENSLLFLLK